DGRQPYADGGRGTVSTATGARVDRHRPQVRAGTRAVLHLVELPLARLDEERPRASPRSHVGLAQLVAQSCRTRSARTLPRLGAAVRPRAAHLRDRRLSIRRAIAAL